MFSNFLVIAALTSCFTALTSAQESGSGGSVSVTVNETEASLFQSELEQYTPSGHLYTQRSENLVLMGNINNATTIKCRFKIYKFKISAAAFTRCTLNYSRPVHYCVYCVDHYELLKKAFLSFSDTVEDSGISCERELLSGDKIQLMQRVWNFVRKLWHDAHCNKCFHPPQDGVYELKESAVQLLHLHSDIYKCYDRYNGSAAMACQECKETYEETNKYFGTHLGDFGHYFCTDLVDGMNFTRFVWNKLFNCSRPAGQGDAGAFVLAALVMLSPFVIYVTTFVKNPNFDAGTFFSKILTVVSYIF